MGCDIHLIVEYRRRKERTVTKERLTKKNPDGTPATYTYTLESKWRTGYTVKNGWSDRVYGMFALLNNVRNYWEDKFKPLPDRGLPEDACDVTLRTYCYKVIPDEQYSEKEDYYDNSDDPCYCRKSDADKWVEEGYSKRYIINDQEWVSGPDWHSPNWCTLQELEDCYKQVFKDSWEGDYIEWAALIGAMKGYEASGEFETRAVYWFDN